MSKCCKHPVIVCPNCGTVICGDCGEIDEVPDTNGDEPIEYFKTFLFGFFLGAVMATMYVLLFLVAAVGP